MKETYVRPEMNVFEFETEDVITASIPTSEGSGNGDSGSGNW